MLIVVSPAKRLDWASRPNQMSRPEFAADAAYLASVAGALSVDALRKLMSISEPLARLNAGRYGAITPDSAAPGPDHRPAIFGFAGDTYAGLEAASLDPEELAWANDHLRILSGLYGVLRPLDGILPYRLEMGSRLATARGRNLYQYWEDRIAGSLRAQAACLGTDVLINCASVEYFSAVDQEALGLRVITPQFLEEKPGGPKVVSFWAKKARGAMARFVIQNQLRDPDAIRDFDIGGYRYAPELSQPDRPAFYRAAMAEA